ncbi:hypothetical protein CK203_001975 [Vitis vinifera]|uniref:Uncharacterized protein n=1 Tax=Vitis vinifera TaxID=29760 RepID=A0A438KJ45_VITVI|nr:hypothetical protein CK203_001975 [Vitis vinifera]
MRILGLNEEGNQWEWIGDYSDLPPGEAFLTYSKATAKDAWVAELNLFTPLCLMGEQRLPLPVIYGIPRCHQRVHHSLLTLGFDCRLLVEAAVTAQRAMHMRWFARRLISAIFLVKVSPPNISAKVKVSSPNISASQTASNPGIMKPSLKVKPETEIQDWSDLLEVPEDFKLYTMMYHMYAECEFVSPRGYF